MEEISEEKAAQMARFIDVFVNTNLSLQEVLSLYKPEEIISQFKPEDVIPQFKPKDVISQFKQEDILSSLDKKQLNQLKRRINMM